MISAIVPSFKNPKCLSFCIQSFLETRTTESELICVIDGFPELYESIILSYQENPYVHFVINPQNKGMPFSINIGAYYAHHSWLLILNDDNVFPKEWDRVLLDKMTQNVVISPNQIEKQNSIFNFITHDFGSVDDFRYREFLETEPSFRTTEELTNDGEIFPFCISKKLFMSVGGFDLIYPSPFVCDWDFFLKLELLNITFVRTRNLNFYHFGSIATKKSTDTNDASIFISSEQIASTIFAQKWGFAPYIHRPSNSHKPNTKEIIRGINFYE
jgi:glycosyltransferase involved in cell wall biosynthesis